MREQGKKVMAFAASQMHLAAARLGVSFEQAIDIILQHKGNTIVCGIGKSGAIAQKLTATLCSTGTRAIFLHAAEAVHGDLGVYTPGDPVILISKSGASPEMVRLLPWFRENGSAIIAIVGNLNSPLADHADYVLDASVERESDPLNLAPTASSSVSMALGDGLAVCLMEARKFTAEDFARNHPGGQLGRNLLLKVRDVMHPLETVAVLPKDAGFRDLILALSSHNLGAACIIENRQLLGIVTDGDIRRSLLHASSTDAIKVADIMTEKPVFTTPDATLREAIEIMENRPSQISVLPVLENTICVGLVRIHDIYHR
jgi:arabinose-5-phosphate isomerase